MDLQAQERKAIILRVRGRVQTKQTASAMREKYTEHVEWPVKTFIMMVKPLMWAALMNRSTMFWPSPNRIPTHFPPRRRPASAMLWHFGCAILNWPMMSPVYPARMPKMMMRRIPLN